MKLLYWIISSIWSLLNRVRRLAPKQSLPHAFVISVGNLQAGGAGKSPFVMALAQQFIAQRASVAIVTRGFGSQSEKNPMIMEPYVALSPEKVGDEVCMMRLHVPEAWFVIGADRVKAFAKLPQKIDVAILDDGFGLNIEKNYEFVLVTQKRWGETWFKHFRYELKRAHWIVYTKGAIPFLQDDTASYTVVTWNYRNLPLYPRLWLVCAIADPCFLIDRLKSFGCQFEKISIFKDHAPFHQKQVISLLHEAKQAKLQLVMTEKDFVKWSSYGVTRSQVFVLEQFLDWNSPELKNLWKTLWESYAQSHH